MSDAKQFVVTDEGGATSWSAKKEAPEIFKTYLAAEKRAHELARATPGHTMSIYGLISEVTAPVSAPITSWPK